MSEIELGIIGGSGLYGMPGLRNLEEIEVSTPFGKPSDSIIAGTLHGRRIAFLPRHGRGHILNPSEVPYRANIFALKSLGVKFIIAVSACGSLRDDFEPGHIVVPDQIYDNTKGIRATSFFDSGIVAHITVANPFSPELSEVLIAAVKNAGGIVHESGTFITIEGPRFSTKAESNAYRQMGMSIIGMTTSPEAFLAAEAEIAYACMAHITDFDVWHKDEEPVTVEMVLKVLKHNTILAQNAISNLVESLGTWEGDFPAHTCLRDTIITDRSRLSPDTVEALAPIIGKYFR